MILYGGIPLLVGAIAYKLFLSRTPSYTYPLTDHLAVVDVGNLHTKIFFSLRTFTLIGLLILAARPVWVDPNTIVHGEGRDIVITIDVSGSMRLFDDERDRRTRIQVAKQEAQSFIQKRIDDPIGIVIFAHDALSLCPVTLDKTILLKTVQGLKLGTINPDGTSLGMGLATAVNRLRRSESKSKIIILLTDGEPTPETDKVKPELAADMAAEFGIKVYTVGIGSRHGGIVHHPLFGYQRAQTRIDEKLLKSIADKTGGQYFRANSPADMAKIYDMIDALEKTEYETNIFHRMYEALFPFFWLLLAFFLCELLLKLTLFRGM